MKYLIFYKFNAQMNTRLSWMRFVHVLCDYFVHLRLLYRCVCLTFMSPVHTDDDIVDTSGEVKTVADYYGEVATEE